MKTPPIHIQELSPLLKISASVENKIRYLCNKYPDREWSGVLFYKPKGSFERRNLVLTAVDLLILDLGSKVFTEYPNHPEIAYFIAENGYEKLSRGLIHSHNTMRTRFSDRDISTLEKEGLDNVHFLSLIVNNDGEYTAKITKQVKHYISDIHEYSTFEGKIIRRSPVLREEITVEYVDITITNHPVADKFPHIMEAFNRIREEENSSEHAKSNTEKTDISANTWSSEYEGQSWGRQSYNNYNGYYPEITESSNSTSIVPASENFILKKLLSLNMGLLPAEAKSLKWYKDNLERFKDIFRTNSEFSEADIGSFITTFAETLLWDDDEEVYADNIRDILEGLYELNEYIQEENKIFKIFLDTLESMLSYVGGFSDIEPEENNTKKDENDYRRNYE